MLAVIFRWSNISDRDNSIVSNQDYLEPPASLQHHLHLHQIFPPETDQLPEVVAQNRQHSQSLVCRDDHQWAWGRSCSVNLPGGTSIAEQGVRVEMTDIVIERYNDFTLNIIIFYTLILLSFSYHLVKEIFSIDCLILFDIQSSVQVCHWSVKLFNYFSPICWRATHRALWMTGSARYTSWLVVIHCVGWNDPAENNNS